MAVEPSVRNDDEILFVSFCSFSAGAGKSSKESVTWTKNKKIISIIHDKRRIVDYLNQSQHHVYFEAIGGKCAQHTMPCSHCQVVKRQN